MRYFDRPATADELRQALAAMGREGLVLVHQDELRQLQLAALGRLAPLSPAGAKVRHLAILALLSTDTDLLAETLVEAMWSNRRRAAA